MAFIIFSLCTSPGEADFPTAPASSPCALTVTVECEWRRHSEFISLGSLSEALIDRILGRTDDVRNVRKGAVVHHAASRGTIATAAPRVFMDGGRTRIAT
uniref:Uncharacterized protein n=1 Tax=Lotharella globosa TaxID=91324 RepID=A0A7S3ZE74_9EUKA